MPRHRLNTTTAKPCRELKKAWALLEEKMSDDVFIEKLILQLPSMQEKYVKEAWSQLNCYRSSFSTRNVSKRTLKTEIYAPFFTLMMATAGEAGKNSDCYVSEKEIRSSVVALRRSNEPQRRPEKHLAIIKPDAAVTLSPGCDPFTMLLIHTVYPYHEETYLVDKEDPYIIHGDKSPGMTLMTATLIRTLIEPDQYGEVALPFLVITGTLCSLYVTTLDHNDFSRIQLVGYPDGGNGSNNDLSVSRSKERKRSFLVFAVLLNKCRTFFEANCRTKYEDMLPTWRQFLLYRPTLFLSRKNHQENNELDGSLEKAAQEAAACDGMYTNVKYPFERAHLVTDHGAGCKKQSTSPYYFTGSPTSTAIGVPNKVFLKVWKSEDQSFHDVESERMHHKRAFTAGIPVAAPVLDEIVRSRSSCGEEHFVFVTEYLDEDPVETVAQVFQYAVSLMETVLQLHKIVGMLHCSLKPDNVRWNKGIVKLIDFEMAQNIMHAQWHPGPPNFLAPEVLKMQPCSIKTDAYSVGKTIRAKLEQLRAKDKNNDSVILTVKVLEVIVAKLTDTDPKARWSLEQAVGHMENHTRHLVSSVSKKRPADTVLVPDQRMK